MGQMNTYSRVVEAWTLIRHTRSPHAGVSFVQLRDYQTLYRRISSVESE